MFFARVFAGGFDKDLRVDRNLQIEKLLCMGNKEESTKLSTSIFLPNYQYITDGDYQS